MSPTVTWGIEKKLSELDARSQFRASKNSGVMEEDQTPSHKQSSLRLNLKPTPPGREDVRSPTRAISEDNIASPTALISKQNKAV